MVEDGGPPEDQPGQTESLLPYEAWVDDAMRTVMANAVAYAAAHGLPGGHHFYITFRTDHPATVIPTRLLAQYPQEMTVVLQNQYQNLQVDEAARTIGVRLSFGGIPANLLIPFDAVSAFADPEVQFGLRFAVSIPDAPALDETIARLAPPAEPDAAPPEPPAATEAAAPQVVSLDAFRRRPRD